MRKNRPTPQKMYGENLGVGRDGADAISVDRPWSTLTKQERRAIELRKIHGRGEHMLQVFRLIKDHLDWSLLANAETTEDIRRAFTPGAMVYRQTIGVSNEFLLSIVHERSFPKTQRGRIEFLGRSCANWGTTSPRTSRDLFEKAKRLEKTPPPKGTILRQEYYIVCSCSYEGPAFHGACPRCSAVIKTRAKRG